MTLVSGGWDQLSPSVPTWEPVLGALAFAQAVEGLAPKDSFQSHSPFPASKTAADPKPSIVGDLYM